MTQMDLQMKPVLELQATLWSNKTTSRELTELALARINDPEGEGFTDLPSGARNRAGSGRRIRRLSGQRHRSLAAGRRLSLKDLFDEQGQQTKAGSKSLEDVAPAAKDSIVTAGCGRRRRACRADKPDRIRVFGSGSTVIRYAAIPGTGKQAVSRGDLLRAPAYRLQTHVRVAIGTDTGGSVRILRG